MDPISPIALGGTYKDSVSGFVGTAIAVCHYLHSNSSVSLQAHRDNTQGKFEDPRWFSVAQVVVAE